MGIHNTPIMALGCGLSYPQHIVYIVYVYGKGGHLNDNGAWPNMNSYLWIGLKNLMSLDVANFCHRSDSIGIGIFVNVQYI